MDIEDLLNQYNEINEKQHFGKTNMKEERYIKNIENFIREAKENIPYELTGIIKQKDFIWDGKTQEIGTLRLMPKINTGKTDNKSIRQSVQPFTT